ncbi:hypothetical protein LINGRAHAP2_LOCUS37056 [Linum grandiflorum]
MTFIIYLAFWLLSNSLTEMWMCGSRTPFVKTTALLMPLLHMGTLSLLIVVLIFPCLLHF